MNNYKNIIFDTFSCDIWRNLSKSNLPILIYGMGNGADKIINAFEKFQINYQDIFASDGFVRGHSFRGKRVLSYCEATKIYPQGFDIVVSFGTKLPDVIELIYSLEQNHRVYSPDVPVCDGELFTEDFFDLHSSELFEARECLSDEKSKQIYDDIIRFKLTGSLKYLKTTSCDESELDSLLNCSAYKSFLDLGAYNGDTVKKYCSLFPNLHEIYAFEPDARNFKKLCAFCDTLTVKAYPLNYACYSSDTTLEFSSSGNRNSSASSSGSFQKKIVKVEAKAPDNIISETDFIKFDVEGLEYDALLGCKRLIQQNSPDLLVSMYHKSEDMFSLPLLVKKLNPDYSLFLRRLPYIPAWDLNLFAIKSK